MNLQIAFDLSREEAAKKDQLMTIALRDAM